MDIRISARTAAKIKSKHGLTWSEVASIYEYPEDLLQCNRGEHFIFVGRTQKGNVITVITVVKNKVHWVKTARRATDPEIKRFRGRTK